MGFETGADVVDHPRAGGRAARRRAPIALLAVLIAALLVPASAGAAPRFTTLPGFDERETPRELDRVGILKIGPKKAKRVLVLAPGTSAGAGYLAPLARQIVRRNRGWQVWSVERRENLLEDQSALDRAKRGRLGAEGLFDYYLGWLTDGSVEPRFQPVGTAAAPYARRWGMNVAVGDLRAVVRSAGARDRTVVLGGHSLGATIATAYASWNFNGRPGARDLDGLALIDGGSPPAATPPSAENAQAQLDELEEESPFLDLFGLGLPWAAGVFNVVGSGLTVLEPDEPSLLQDFALTPGSLKPPVPATNAAQYGYVLDTETGSPGLALVQMHLGGLAAEGDPRPWEDGGLVAVRRAANVFQGTGLLGIDGSAWYHPRRLSIDAGAVNGGVANPAQQVLGVRATRGDEVKLPIMAFAASLGGQRVLDAASSLAERSGVGAKRLILVDRAATYAHLDPIAAAPRNAFANRLSELLRLAAR